MRMPAVCTARQQTVMAIAESMRKMSPSVSPRVSLTMNGRPSVPISFAVMFPVAIIATSMSRPPTSPAAASARMIAGGACLRGSFVSSASEPAVSKPYIT